MGKRGPKPKPTSQLALAGSWRARLNSNEPQFPRGYPPKPADFNAEESLLWDQIIEQLYPLGLITPAAGIALATLVKARVEEIKADEMIRRTGLLVKRADNVLTLNPLLKARDRARTFVQRGLEAFGMTPSAATKIRVDNAIAGSLPQNVVKLTEKTTALLDK